MDQQQQEQEQHERRRLIEFFLDGRSYAGVRLVEGGSRASNVNDHIPPTAPTDEVKHFETHISHVFLAGAFAFKLKKRVHFDFLDFSNLAARKRCCEEELRLNSAYSDGLYLDVLPVSDDNGRLAFGSKGRIVDYVVRMKRFDENDLFSALLESGELNARLVAEASRLIARFHGAAPVDPSFGSAEELKREITQAFEPLIANTRLHQDAADVLRASIARLHALETLITSRRGSHVRRIHGDLHLRNICRFHGRVNLFDGIEFSAELGHGDVWSDVGFFIMDLIFRKRPELAAEVWNVYLEETDDFSGIRLMSLFVAYGAVVRAKVALLSSGSGEVRDKAEAEASEYLAVASGSLSGDRRPRVIAVGGLSGSGKSTVSRALADSISAVHVRADAVRKHLHGAALQEKLPETAYSSESSEKTYEGMLERAKHALAAGMPVVIDAVFQSEQWRERVEAFAAAEGVEFIGAWCEVSDEIARQRIEARRDDVSDADVGVFERQRAGETGSILWAKVDTTGAVDDSVRKIGELFS